MFGAYVKAGVILPNYGNSSEEYIAYRLRVALDRDGRFNSDEKDVYERTKAELEFGRGFFGRAHP